MKKDNFCPFLPIFVQAEPKILELDINRLDKNGRKWTKNMTPPPQKSGIKNRVEKY